MTVSRLQPGDQAPDFALTASDATVVRLGDLRGGRTVLYFYPAANTPGCTTQACDFRDNIASLQGHGYRVVGVSPDPPETLAGFDAAHGLGFTLLGDPSVETMRAYGAYGEKKLYGKSVTGVIRSTFVLDTDTVVEKAMYNVRATGHVAKLRRDLGID